MRGRLTLAFVCLALLMAGVGGAIRADAIADQTRTTELDRLARDAEVITALLDHLAEDGVSITPDRLAPFVPDETELTVERPGGRTVTVAGDDYDADDADEAPRVRTTSGNTTVSIVQDASVVPEEIRRNLTPLLALIAGMLLVAGLLGLIVARLLARPFHQLAESATALGRGRFDFKAPKSKIPEVVSIATSLEASATQLRDSLRRDREFFHHASHVLRTPLTGMRLELEELCLRDDVDEDVKASATKCLTDAERLDTTVAELLAFARARSLVAGAEVSLLTLGSHVAQRWRDRLPESREVRAYVDGGADYTLTPGPVEQLLDSVLRDVADSGTGAVTLRFAGEEEHIKLTVSCGPAKNRAEQRPSAQVARTIAEVLGGRFTGDATSGDLEILLPRR